MGKQQINIRMSDEEIPFPISPVQYLLYNYQTISNLKKFPFVFNLHFISTLVSCSYNTIADFWRDNKIQ